MASKKRKIKKSNLKLISFLVVITAVLLTFILYKIHNNELATSNYITTLTPYPTPFTYTRTNPPTKPIIFNEELFTSGSNGINVIFSDTYDSSNEGSFGLNPVLDENTGTIYFPYKQNVMSYSLTNKTKNTVYTVNNNNGIDSIKFVSPNLIYITEGIDILTKNNNQTVEELNLDTKQIRKIINMDAGLYSGLSFVGNIDNNSIIRSQGGDGCGGWGTIYKVVNGNPTVISDSGGGCSTAPRYIGYIQDKRSILMAGVLPAGNNAQPGEFFKWDVLYLQNVDTGIKDPIYDLKKFNGINYITLDDTGKKAIIATEINFNVLNLETREIENTLKISGSIQAIRNNKIYYLTGGGNTQNVNYSFVDLASGQIVSNQKTTNSDAYFLGIWQSNPLYFVSSVQQ